MASFLWYQVSGGEDPWVEALGEHRQQIIQQRKPAFVTVLPLTEPVMTLAESIGPATLRSLGAIHLAAAAHFKQELTAFVTYDHRLADACRDIGLATASPGATV